MRSYSHVNVWLVIVQGIVRYVALLPQLGIQVSVVCDYKPLLIVEGLRSLIIISATISIKTGQRCLLVTISWSCSGPYSGSMPLASKRIVGCKSLRFYSPCPCMSLVSAQLKPDPSIPTRPVPTFWRGAATKRHHVRVPQAHNIVLTCLSLQMPT